MDTHAGGYQPLADTNEAILPAFDELIKDCFAQHRSARIATAQEFVRRIRSAFRVDVPLSSLLTDARLHEIAAALRQMSAEDFSARPRGQKLLLINRLKDLLRIDKPELCTGTAEVIALLTRLARSEGEAEYRPIVTAAFDWGFEKWYGPNWQGNEDIRDALVDAAKSSNDTSHRVLAQEFISFLSGKDLTMIPRWSTHNLRILVMALLANPRCGDGADQLADLYDRINEASH